MRYTLTVGGDIIDEGDDPRIMNNAFKIWIKWAYTTQEVVLKEQGLGVLRRGWGQKVNA